MLPFIDITNITDITAITGIIATQFFWQLAKPNSVIC